MSDLPPPFGSEPSEAGPRLAYMRDDELRRILADANPWWGAATACGNRQAKMRLFWGIVSAFRTEWEYSSE